MPKRCSEGAKRIFRSEIALSVTGIAGPDGEVKKACWDSLVWDILKRCHIHSKNNSAGKGRSYGILQ